MIEKGSTRNIFVFENVIPKRESQKNLSFTVSKAWDSSYNRPWQFLDENDVSGKLSFEDSVNKKVIFLDILQKDL